MPSNNYFWKNFQSTSVLVNSVLEDTPAVPARLRRWFLCGSTLSPTKKRRVSAMQRKKRFYHVNYLAARGGWDSTVLYRQERLILMSGKAWRLLLPRLLPSCCTSPSSCSHRKLWNRLLGSNLDSCCRTVALTHTGGHRLVCNSCWSIKYAQAQNVGVKSVLPRHEPSSAGKQGKELSLAWSLVGYVRQNLVGWMLSHSHHQSQSQISVSPLQIQWDCFKTWQECNMFLYEKLMNFPVPLKKSKTDSSATICIHCIYFKGI